MSSPPLWQLPVQESAHDSRYLVTGFDSPHPLPCALIVWFKDLVYCRDLALAVTELY